MISCTFCTVHARFVMGILYIVLKARILWISPSWCHLTIIIIMCILFNQMRHWVFFFWSEKRDFLNTTGKHFWDWKRKFLNTTWELIVKLTSTRREIQVWGVKYVILYRYTRCSCGRVNVFDVMHSSHWNVWKKCTRYWKYYFYNIIK